MYRGEENRQRGGLGGHVMYHHDPILSLFRLLLPVVRLIYRG